MIRSNTLLTVCIIGGLLVCWASGYVVGLRRGAMPPGACEGFRPAQVGEVVDRPTPTAFAQLMKTIAAERPMAEALRGPERGYVATREVVAVIVSKTLDDGQWVLHLRDQEDHRTIPNV